MNPEDVSVLMFDLDGTLRNSMDPNHEGGKPTAFAKATTDFHPDLVDYKEEIKHIYLETAGANRIDQLREVERRLDVAPLEETTAIEEWSPRFSGYIDETSLPLFPEAERVLRTLKGVGYTLMLGTAVPQTDVERIIPEYYPEISDLFDGVLGNQWWGSSEGAKEPANFVKGIAYMAFAYGRHGVLPHQTAYVGDTPEDMLRANTVGMFTVGYVFDSRYEQPMAESSANQIITNLEQLLDIFTGAETKN